MLSIISLITGPLGKVLGIGALVVVLLAGAAYVIRQHDDGIRAEIAAASQAAQIKALQEQQTRTTDALQSVAEQSAAIARNIDTIRGTVNAVPHTTSCAASPAVRAAFDGLRQSAGNGHGSPAANPGHALGVPRSARRPVKRR